jgi:formylglycine-generating enzyme required for sulfatase activity
VSVTAFTGCPAAGPVPGETKIFDGIEFVWIPAGSFTMGSPADETGHQADETQHKVTISRGFWLGKTEVTQAQWIAVMDSNLSFFSGSIKPVDLVSWDDVQYFLAALNAGKSAIGGPYRLPTESEWEYAYRAGTTARFYWGEDDPPMAIGDYAWYNGNSSSMTHDVGEKLFNAWGLYEMSGNVWEWCQDWIDAYPAGPVTDPQGPHSGTDRVLRGGSWADVPANCRAALRLLNAPDFRYDYIGFRLLRTQD